MTEKTPIITSDIALEQELTFQVPTILASAIFEFSTFTDEALELASENPLVTRAFQLASQLGLSSEQEAINPFITAAIIGGVIGVGAGFLKSLKGEEKSIKKTVGYMIGGAAVGVLAGEFVFVSSQVYGVSEDL